MCSRSTNDAPEYCIKNEVNEVVNVFIYQGILMGKILEFIISLPVYISQKV